MKNLKMRSKLIVLSLVTGVIPILIISVMFFVSSSKEIEKCVLNSNTIFSSLVKDQLNSYFDERIGEGNVVSKSENLVLGIEKIYEEAYNPEIKGEGLKEISDFILSIRDDYDYSDIFVTDNRGIILYSVNYNEESAGQDLRDRNYIARALSGKQNWSELFYSDIENSPYLGVLRILCK